MQRKDPSNANVSARSRPFGESDELATVSVGEGARRAVLFPTEEVAPRLGPSSGNEREVALGRYVVIAELGRGGMGVVLRAYDPKLHREVALKRLRSSGVSAELQARMVREAHAMAKLNHPHVVGLYDLEFIGDGVLLAMEYVDGCDLGRWLERQRSAREILQTFAQAGRGLQAAHEAGLLHRDFKPANVLVTQGGVAKVTDFGLARLEDQYPTGERPEASDGTGQQALSGALNSLASGPLTAMGTVMGTPVYMAPEQHRHGSLSAAADQYAFCVSLWQALTGSLPFPSAGEGSLLGRKLVGPPAWPKSTPSLPRPVLDAIVRGLSPAPEQRWPSMAHLLEALAYDPRRRRSQAYVVGGALVVATLGAGGLNAWGVARAQRCSGAEQHLERVWAAEHKQKVKDSMLGVGASFANGAWRRAEHVLDGFATQWRSSYTETCEATLRREQSSDVMDLRMACLHRAKVDLQAVVKVLSQADAEVVQNAEKVTDHLPDLEDCGDVSRLRADVEPPAAEDAPAVEVARVHIAEARAFDNAGKYDAAAKAVADARTALGEVEYGRARVELATVYAENLASRGEYEASQTAWREALTLALAHGNRRDVFWAANRLVDVLGAYQRKFDAALEHRAVVEGALGQDPVDEAHWRTTLAELFRVQGKYEEAEAEARASLELRTRALGPDHLGVAASRNNLGIVLDARAQYAEAESEYRAALELWTKMLGPDHPHVATARNNLGIVLSNRGRYDEAQKEYRLALALRTRALGPEHPDVAMSRNNLAGIHCEQEEYDEAEAEYRVVLQLQTRALGPRHPDVAGTRYNLCLVLNLQGKHDEAEAECRASLELRIQASGSAHPDVAASRQALASALLAQARHEEAEAEYLAAIALWTDLLGPEHPDLARSRLDFADVLVAQGKYQQAEAELRATLQLLRGTLDPEHPLVNIARCELAGVLLELQRPMDARVLVEQAWSSEARHDLRSKTRADAAFVLARSVWMTDSSYAARMRARELAQSAAQSYRELRETDAEQRVQAWLKRHSPPRGRVGSPQIGPNASVGTGGCAGRIME